MEQGSTWFLRAVIVVMGLLVLAFCIFAVPGLSVGISGFISASTGMRYFMLLDSYAAAIAFFVVLYQGLRLLNYIDKNVAFSTLSINALKNIKYFAVAISVFFFAGLPVPFRIAQIDDAPGLAPISFAVACAPLVIAVFAAVLQKLVQSALELKAENDLVI